MLSVFFLISFASAFLITPGIIQLYKKYGWLDDPQTHKHAKVTHKRAIPRGGGLVIFVAILFASSLLLHLMVCI